MKDKRWTINDNDDDTLRYDNDNDDDSLRYDERWTINDDDDDDDGEALVFLKTRNY